MPSFDISNVDELKKLVYNSYVHDAIIKCIKYEFDALNIKCFNYMFNTEYTLSFKQIKFKLEKKGDWGGSKETIFSLTIEDISSLEKEIIDCDLDLCNCIYVVIQMLSGDELHIVASKISFEGRIL